MRARGSLFIALLLLSGCDGGGRRFPGDGGDGRDGGRPPDGGGGDGGGGPRCEGISLLDDGVLDLDLDPAAGATLVRVQGMVTLDGAPLPARAALGSLRFVSEGSAREVALATGAPSYEIELAPGRHDVHYVPPDDARCDAAEVLPCIGGVVDGEVAIERGGVLDLDVRTVAVHVSLRIDGAPVTTADGLAVSLAPADADERALLPVAPGSLSARVVRGDYAVGVETDGGHCDGRSVPALPCNGGEVLPSVALRSDGALDVEVRTAALRGRVTANGGPLGAGPGSLSFGSEEDDSFRLHLAADGSYALRLLAGRYDVRWDPDDTCDGRTAPPAPCLGTTLRERLAIESDGVLDLDLPAHRVSGRVLANGAPIAAPYSGSIVFALAGEDEGDEGEGAVALPFDAATARYEVTLPTGVYDVSFAPIDGLCDGTRAPTGPCSGVELLAGARIAADGVLDLDLPYVRVSGTVTVDGAPLAEPPSGALRFARGDEDTLFIRFDGSGRYEASVAPGETTIGYAGDATRCGEPTQLPCLGGPILSRELVLGGGGVLDLDLRTGRLEGTVTIEGRVPPEGGRARLRLRSAAGDSGELPLAEIGPARFDARVLAGSYAIEWVPEPGCAERDASGPCVDGPLDRDVTIEPPGGALDLDVPLARIVGLVTLRGGPLPAGARGRVSFERVDVESASLSVSLPESGPADYVAPLLPGRYVVSFEPSGACEPGGLPCTDVVLLGCEVRR